MAAVAATLAAGLTACVNPDRGTRASDAIVLGAASEPDNLNPVLGYAVDGGPGRSNASGLPDRCAKDTGLDGDLAKAEPKRLRYRILHTAARLVHGQRRRWLRIPLNWPWAEQITAAFNRITAIPAPD